MFLALTQVVALPLGLSGRLYSAVDPDLAAHWTLDDGSGPLVADSSLNDNTGNLFGDPSWTTGPLDEALSFDGNNDYVDAGNHPSLNLTDAVTVTTWVNFSQGGIDQKIAGN